MSDWVITSKNGRIRVYGSRKKIGGKMRDRLNWTDKSGSQRHTTLAIDKHDARRAQRYATELAERESKGTASSDLRASDKLQLYSGKDALEGTGIGVDVACRGYRRCMEILEGTGLTPEAAAERIADLAGKKTATVEQVELDLMSELEASGKSVRYIRDMKLALLNLRTEFEGRNIGEITRGEIQAYITEKAGRLAAKTWNNTRGSVYSIFEWSIKKGYALKNPVRAIPKKKIKRSIKAYTSEDVEKILAKSPPELIPFVVLQAFGCLRSAEVCRVKWTEHIQLDKMIIRATEDITKTTETRIIKIPKNLAEWLKPYQEINTPLYEGTELGIGSRMRKRLAKAIPAAGVKGIPNGLRKACASHLVPKCQHIGEAAEMMGHTVSEMKKSYRELRSEAEADIYWDISPKIKKPKGRRKAG
jgi:integrase